MSTLPLSPAETGPDLQVPGRASDGPAWPARVRAVLQGERVYALADQVVYSFGNLAVAAALSRYSAARTFGVYILTQRAMDVLIQLSNVFLWAPFTFHLPGTEDSRRAQYQGSLFLLQAIFCILATALLCGAAYCSALPGHEDLHETFVALVVPGGALLFREFTRRLYFAHMRMRVAFWTEVATVSLQVAGVALLCVLQQVSVYRTLVVLGLGASLVNGWWLLREWGGLEIQRSAVVADLRRDFRLGRWFFGSNMVYLAGAQCNPWLLNSMLGGGSVGAYSICESLVNIPRVALTSMQNVMAPTIARAHLEGGRPKVRLVVARMNRALLAGSGIFCVALWFCGVPAARLLYHRVPADARLITALLAVNLVLYASTMAQSYGLTALDRTDSTLYAQAAGFVVQAGMSFWLIRAFHLPGAAAALALGSLVVLAVRQVFYQREMAA